MKISKIVVLLWLILGTSLLAMEASQINPSVIPPDNIVRLVFMGKTGAGKSTSINACYNFAKDIKWDTFPKLFPIKTKYQACNVMQYVTRNAEDHTRGQLGAVTQEPSEYMATGANLVVSLIDCPGTADPRGVAKDIEITKDIAQFLKQVGDFNAICIVLKGSMNRATAEELYFIEQIKTIIPKSSINRIFLVLTHTTRASQDVKDFAESVGLPIDNIFAFDHFAISEEGHVDLSNDEDGIAGEIEVKWGVAKKSFDRLITKAKGLGKYSTEPMGRICEIKQSTSEKIYAALRKVDSVEQTEIQLDDARVNLERAMREHGAASSNKQSAEQALREAQAEKQVADALNAYINETERKPCKTSKHNTICTICAVVCHPECNLEYKGDHWTEHLVGCGCIKDGFCTQCDGRCNYVNHRHGFRSWETVTRIREDNAVKTRQSSALANYGVMSSNLDSKQRDLDLKTGEKNRLNNLLDDIKSCLDNLKREKTELQHQIVELYVELDKVSMGSISFHIGEYYNLCIQNADSVVKRSKLEKDRAFYIEQVELYKRRIGGI